LALVAGGPGALAGGGAAFRDATEEAGLDFVHVNGMSGQLVLPEITGPGAALFDFDNDGDLDLYLVQGGPLGPDKTDADRPTDRLYRNGLEIRPDGSRSVRFTDMTGAAGLKQRGYGMGVACGDFDNDGWTDLYVTNLGPDALLRNQGDGTFRDVTARAGLGDPRWNTSAAFFDLDRDGWLDLYVTAYVEFSLARSPRCYAPSTARDYCGPDAFPPIPDRLFRNRGGGRFEDVTAAAGVGEARAAGLGVVAADFDGDGWIDLYVANDGDPNFLWLNRKDGTFRDQALLAGAAVNRMGSPEASMGVDAGDFDNDGDLDLFMTHLTQETHTLYVNQGRGLFEDRTAESGLGAAVRRLTGFGTGWLDFDGDGWQDLLLVAGEVRHIEALAQAGDPFPLRQPKQLWRNTGRGRFVEVPPAEAGPAFALAEVSRGAAFGDVDNDGDTDVVVANNNGPARLLLNEAGGRWPWLGLRLLEAGGKRDALGALVEVLRPGLPPLVRRAHTDGSYASASDPRVLIGLGQGSDIAEVRVRWPDGRIEAWPALPAGRYVTLRQGGAPQWD
jgi:hypothetical protein